MAKAKGDAKRLLTDFQELCGFWHELSKGNEDENLVLVDLAEKMRQEWLMAYNDNLGLKSLVGSLERDMQLGREREKTLKEELTDARAQVASLLTHKRTLQADVKLLEEQADAVREILKDDVGTITERHREKLTVFLSQSRLVRPMMVDPPPKESMSFADDFDLDYDKTGDSIEEGHEAYTSLRSGKVYRRSDAVGKKRSHSRHRPDTIREERPEEVVQTPPKRSRDEDRQTATGATVVTVGDQEEIVATTTLTVPSAATGGQPSARLEIKRRSLNRSFSEPHLVASTQPTAPPVTSTMRLTPRMASAVDVRSPSGMVTSWASGTTISSRRHQFGKQSIPLIPEYCDVCTKRVAFGKSILKCSDCRFICHVDCRERAPLPCVPRIATPKDKQPHKINEFVPDHPPMIPHLIIHLVTELDRRGLESVGLYRIPGSEKDVNSLLNTFLTSRGVPGLSKIDDPAVLTGCIKKFLSKLKEPLIPPCSWQEFVACAEAGCRGKSENSSLERAIVDLPMPNRDTLAYLMIHWQGIADNADLNKMPLENLSRVLAPTIVGYSSGGASMPKMMDELPRQEMVMSAMLHLRRGFWLSLIDYECAQPLLLGAVGHRASPLTPDSPFDPSRSGFMATHATPRSTRTIAAKADRRHFFQPPWN